LNPKAGVFGSFGQDFALFGDSNYVKSTLRVGAETLVWGEEIKLSAVFDAGALTYAASSASSVTDRHFLSSRQFRGFAPGGIGPRQIVYDDITDTIKSNDALGGNYYAVARLESKFPLGLPEEYGISGGAFIDIGSLWGLDSATLDVGSMGNPNESEVFHEFALRSVVGVSIFWKTPIGPLRFNWTQPLNKQTYDTGQSFDFTVSTSY
jgi:outer membrane protein insertion porin family